MGARGPPVPVLNGAVSDEHGGGAPAAPEVSGDGLLLRRWRADSADDVEAWLTGHLDREFLHWNTPRIPVGTIDEARDALRSRIEGDTHGGLSSFCITEASTGEILGHISVNETEPAMLVARVGFWVLPAARGRRVASRALALTTAWSFAELGLHRMELAHALGHDASCRIGLNCGFLAEGVLRGAMFEAGRFDAFRDLHLHGRLATDPEPGTGAGPLAGARHDEAAPGPDPLPTVATGSLS